MADQQPVINLEWMDEQVRHFRNELIKAQQEIGSQAEEIRQQARHIEDLEGRLSSTQTQMNRVNVLERALDQYKEEIRLLVEQESEAYQQDRREAARIKLIEQDTTSRSIAEIRKGLTVIPRIQEDVNLRTAEEQRISDAQLTLRQRVMDLEKRIDTEVRGIPYLEEQRTRDAKYIAQLQEQVASLLKGADSITNRFLVVEEIAHRNSRNVEELVTIRAELQQRQRKFLEEMQITDQQRQSMVREWADLEEAREKRMQEFSVEVQTIVQQFQKVKGATTSLESLGERLQREQHEVSELQRLGEQRQRAKMEEWETQAEKRWQREKLLWEQQWHDHDRRNAEHLERLLVAENRGAGNEEQVAHIWDLFADDLRLQTESLQNRVIKISEQMANHRRRNHQAK